MQKTFREDQDLEASTSLFETILQTFTLPGAPKNNTCLTNDNTF